MSNRTFRILLLAVLVATAPLVGACGKSTEEKAQSGDVTRSGGTSLNPAGAPMKAALNAAGYEPVFFRRFPSQVPGMKAKVVVYHAKSGKDGGVLYLQEYGDRDRVVWHWYFEKDAPDSVTTLEVNGDGLWDVRMYAGGEAHDYVQDQSFTFVAPQRDDRIAMNGASSEPVDADAMAWKCFDGDTTTAWRSKAPGAYVDLPVPLGIEEGILSVRLLTEHQPASCELEADGKKVQSFDLQPTAEEQLIHLDPDAKKATALRLVVRSTQGGDDEAAISELGLK